MHVDNETVKHSKNIWEEVSEAINGSDNNGDEDDTALQDVIAQEDKHGDKIKSINLQEFDIITSSAIKKKVN